MPCHHDSGRVDLGQVFLHFYSPLIFPYESGFLVPAESDYAIVEVKQVLTRQYMRDVIRKIGSVRRLNRTSVRVPYAGGSYPPKKPHRILGVLAATRSVWGNESFRPNLVSALAQLDDSGAVDLGCVVTQGAFEVPAKRGSHPAESLICFMIRLIERLRALGNAPAVDLMAYGRSLQSLY